MHELTLRCQQKSMHFSSESFDTCQVQSTLTPQFYQKQCQKFSQQYAGRTVQQKVVLTQACHRKNGSAELSLKQVK